MQNGKDYVLLALVVVVSVVAGGLLLGSLQGASAQYAGSKYAPAMMSAGIVAGNSGAAAVPGGSWSPWGTDRRIISASGSVTKSYAPNEAAISLSVETKDKSASKSQQMNAELTTKVVAALKAAGVPAEDIDTSSYNLYQDYRWDSVTNKSEPDGYRTQNSITVTLKDITLSGKVIDAAVNAGANRVDGVTFSLSRAKEAQVRSELLSVAAATAKGKAERIASGFGSQLGNLYTANEGYSYVPVYNQYLKNSYDAAGSSAPMAETPITPGDVMVTITVDAKFEIK